jgi:hypothetical protein
VGHLKVLHGREISEESERFKIIEMMIRGLIFIFVTYIKLYNNMFDFINYITLPSHSTFNIEYWMNLYE